jgi:hypothetical protein
MCFGVLPFAVGRNPANLGPPVTDFLTVRTDRYQFQPPHRPARPLARPSVRPSVRPHTRYTRADADVNFRLPCPRLSTWFSFPFFFSLPKKACYTNSFLPISFWLPASFWARRKDKTRQGVKWKEKKFLEREICRKKKRETLLVIQTQKEMPWHHPTSLFPLVLKLSGFSSPSCELALCHLLKGHIHIGFGGGGGKRVGVVWVWVLITLPNLYIYKAYPLLERW